MLMRKYHKTFPRKASLLVLIGIIPVVQIVYNLDLRSPKKRIILTRSGNIELILNSDLEQRKENEMPERENEEIVLDSDDDKEVQRRRRLRKFYEEPSIAWELHQERIYNASSQMRGPPNAGMFSNLTIWSLNDQQGITEDLYLLFKKYKVNFHSYELQSFCLEFNTCPSEIKGISTEQILNTLSNIQRQFQTFLLTIPQFVKSDIVLCLSPVSLCSIYQNLNKTVIIYITEKYNAGILQPKVWRKWNEALNIINSRSQNSVLASDVYNVQYVNYFTSLEPKMIQPYVGYMNLPFYLVKQDDAAGIVPFENKNLMKSFYHKFYKLTKRFKENLELTEYEVSITQIIKFKLIVYLPSRVSSLRFVELYRQNVPLLVPSLELLTRWHLKDNVINEKTRNSAFSFKSKGSAIPGVISLPDPNNERDPSSVGFWLQFMDIYSFPHILYFSSIEDLIQKMLSTEEFELVQISKSMELHNEKEMSEVENKWSSILSRL